MKDEYVLNIYYDKPIEYRGLKFHPVKVENYFLFSLYSTCLTIDKNSKAENIRILYLDYLFKLLEEDFQKNPYLIYFDKMLELCLPENKDSFENGELEKTGLYKYKYDEKGRAFFVINGENFYNNDFMEIRSIIAEQNMIELIDERISKEVRDSLEKAKRYKDKHSSGGGKQASIEDIIVSLSVGTGWSFEYIYNLSIRKFLKSIERLDNLIHYKIYLQASMSGMVEFKDKSFIKHWLSNLEKDKYGDVSVDVETVKENINFESAKKKAQRKK
jgi:hypothetical protein